MSADVCLLLEGSYPYQQGGVSTWVDRLIKSRPDLQFHLVTLLAPLQPRELCYDLPDNVCGQTVVHIGTLGEGLRKPPQHRALLAKLENPLNGFLGGEGNLACLVPLMEICQKYGDTLGRQFLLNGEGVWHMMLRLYRETMPRSPFIDYFWSWRNLVAGIFSVLLAPLPQAKLYHAISTGYAGLFLARAVQQTGRPGMVTEHGIYTNERRIEIAMANWLYEVKTNRLALESIGHQLRHLWIQTFVGFGRACYDAATEIIALYGDSQIQQVREGAETAKMRLICNGVDVARFTSLAKTPRAERQTTVALIGRVVPVKDILSFLRAAYLLRKQLPDVRFLVLGSLDEDPDYVQACRRLCRELDLQERVSFTGTVAVEEYLGEVDVVVLTSISEAQPLAIMEAGAAAIPVVATDVGACREMLVGATWESPPIGPGGVVTAPADPEATSQAIFHLLEDHIWYDSCAAAAAKRMKRYYQQSQMNARYQGLYDHYLVQAKGDIRRWLV